MLIGRRPLLAGGAAVVTGASGAVAGPNTLIVAGPAGGRLDRWAEMLAGRVGRGLPGRMPLARQNVGGVDGVTGANQFDARGEPDGTMALLVPGTAALSWLVGEGRAKFDPGRWIPLLAGATTAVLVSKVALVPGTRLRVAGESPAGPELPVLIALDMLGIDGQLVGASSPDAVLVKGDGVAAAIRTAASSGMVPVMTFGAASGAALPERDPLLPQVPTAFELASGQPAGVMGGMLLATALAVQLDAGLMLPQLTPAATVALWRGACAAVTTDSELAAEAARLAVRLIPASAAADCNSRIAGDADMVLALRRWLAARYGWQAG